MKVALSLAVVALLTIILTVAEEDFRARAPGDERARCVDKPDTTAWMARLPGEPHTIETCIQVMKFSSPNWIPQFTSPLKGPR